MSYYAITTRILGATNTKGTRIVAEVSSFVRATCCITHRVVLPYNYAMSNLRNHQRAAERIVRLNGWFDRAWHPGDVRGGIVWVCPSEDAFKVHKPYTCQLCGQRIDDGKPCGCGARP